MKKRFLELLILQAGLTPQNIKTYRTDGCDGQYQIAVGWMCEGVDANGEVQISVITPEGFNDAVAMVMEQILKMKNVRIHTEYNFKV